MLSLANMYDDWGPVIRYLEKKGGCEDRAVFMYWKRHSVRLPSDAAVRLCSAPSPWIRLYWLETYGEAGEEYATRNIRPLQEDVTQMLDRIEKLKTQWQRGHERSV